MGPVKSIAVIFAICSLMSGSSRADEKGGRGSVNQSAQSGRTEKSLTHHSGEGTWISSGAAHKRHGNEPIMLVGNNSKGSKGPQPHPEMKRLLRRKKAKVQLKENIVRFSSP